ncbi:L7Ae/L30e/S12e/Gadd45 family ribosomal protein [Paenibacillus sp. y28]|uniref:L7Ae/L30e/S12e/Gadd45 family ribosomal protein n=1 Tax=Paenibacillus sp. y28 TaxID=3129110 RepID=UPI003015C499
MNPKTKSYLGLAMRAGKLVTGDEGVLKAVRSGEARLVLIAEDAAGNARKKFTDKCSHYGVQLLEAGSRFDLGACIGKPERVVVAVCDAGFAKLIRESVGKPVEVETD